MNKPLILDFARERKEGKSPQFFYDEKLSLNVVETDGKLTPFVEMKKYTNETVTKTFVQREEDDDDLVNLEMLTKTKEDRESDDEDFMELLTKTDATPEKDDEDFMELMTKTEAGREKDDDDFFYFQ